MIKHIVNFTLLALFLVGCSGDTDNVSGIKKEPGIYVGERDCLMDDLSPEDVILIVNGEKFTKSDFLVAVRLFDKISRLRAGDPLTGPNKYAEAAVQATNPRTLSDILRRALIRQYAEKHGVRPSAEMVNNSARRSLTTLRQSNATLDQVAEAFGGPEGRLLIEYNYGDALDEAMRKYFDKENILNLTDADIMTVSNRWSRSQAAAASSNAVQRASLEKAISELKNNADFAEVAKKYSSTPEDGKYWDEFLLEEFEEFPAVVEWLKTSKTGDISGILEMDDGWSVVKVVSRHKEEFPPPGISEPRDLWSLVRISRPLYETVESLPREEIVKGLIANRSRTLQKRVGDAVMENAVIEWPCGTNLFNRAKN